MTTIEIADTLGVDYVDDWPVHDTTVDFPELGDPLGEARGIFLGLLISSSFWLGLVISLWVR